MGYDGPMMVLNKPVYSNGKNAAEKCDDNIFLSAWTSDIRQE